MAEGSSSRQPLPIRAIFGDESFLKRRQFDQITRELTDGGEPPSIGRYDGREATLADVLDEVCTASLLGGRRLVVVDDADTFITRYREGLEKYAANPSQSGVLVLLCRSLQKNTRLYKAIDRTGEIIECKGPREYQVASWLTDHAKQLGITITGEAAQLLADNIGSDLGRVHAELEKLKTYVGDKGTIRPEHVEQLSTLTAEQNAFALADRMVAGDTSGAMKLLHDVLYLDRNAAFQLLGAMHYRFRQLLAGARMIEEGMNPKDAAGRAKVFGNRQKEFFIQIRQRSATWFGRVVNELHAIDAASKIGRDTVLSGMERLIVKACPRKKAS